MIEKIILTLPLFLSPFRFEVTHVSLFSQLDVGGGAIRVHDVHPLPAPFSDSGGSPAAPVAVVPNRLPPTIQRLSVGQLHATSSRSAAVTRRRGLAFSGA